MSTTSGAILAPATILAEYIIKPRWRTSSDAKLMRVFRGSAITVAVASNVMVSLKTNIYHLVALGTKLSIVFCTSCGRLVLEKGDELGAILSISMGMTGWPTFKYAIPSEIPSLL